MSEREPAVNSGSQAVLFRSNRGQSPRCYRANSGRTRACHRPGRRRTRRQRRDTRKARLCGRAGGDRALGFRQTARDLRKLRCHLAERRGSRRQSRRGGGGTPRGLRRPSTHALRRQDPAHLPQRTPRTLLRGLSAGPRKENEGGPHMRLNLPVPMIGPTGSPVREPPCCSVEIAIVASPAKNLAKSSARTIRRGAP